MDSYVFLSVLFKYCIVSYVEKEVYEIRIIFGVSVYGWYCIVWK